MRRVERLALWLLASYALCGCTRTVEVKTEAHEQLHEVVQEHETQAVTTTVQTGPSETRVFKFALPSSPAGVVLGPASPGPVAVVTGPASTALGVPSVQPADGLPAHGPLIEMDVITAGATTSTTSASACEDEGLNLTRHVDEKAETKTATRYGPPWWLLLVAGMVLAGAGWAVWRFSLAGRIAKAVSGL